MMVKIRRPFGQHYALLVVAIVFLALLAVAGLRSTPGVLMVPWSNAFGWSRGVISLAAAVGIFLFGMTGPFAAAAMQRFGVRPTMLAALGLMSGATALSLLMTSAWQLVLLWGVFSGLGSGCIANVLSATIANRWFVANRGLVMGLLAASTSTGTLIFFPGLSALAQSGGWRPVVLTVAVGLAALMPVVAFLLPEWPADVQEVPLGADANHPVSLPNKSNPLRTAFAGLAYGLKTPDFWLLAGTFFVCGFTTNGLVGTHMIALCSDHGMAAVAAGSLLAIMGVFDLVGTTLSGWLTDRVDPRKLLFAYYGLRGLSLIYLPFSDFSFYGLSLFAVFYGLDWIATVPPTLALSNKAFGELRSPVIFGWISASHQVGAASAAFLAGLSRTLSGTYLQAFVLAGLVAMLAAGGSLLVGRMSHRTVAA
jgi:MFS family permease